MNSATPRADLSHEGISRRYRRSGLQYLSGWRQIPLKLRFALSLALYAVRRKKYPLFSLKSLRPIRKGKILAIHRISVLDGYCYTTTMRVPRWPSPAFDHMIANGGLGMESDTLVQKKHVDSVILAITRKCTYECEHCYEYANRADTDTVSVDKWKNVIAQLQDFGASVVILSGGEPMLRYEDLISILESADKSRTDFHLHTTGIGMSLERARALKKAGLVAAGVGLDHPDAGHHDQFRGRQGAYRVAVKAIDELNRAGLFTYINTCLQKETVRNGDLWRLIDLAKDLQVGTVNFLEPKSCGRYGSRKPDELFTEEDKGRMAQFATTVNRGRAYKDYPPVSYIAPAEKPENFGCLMGGLSHFTIDGAGNVNPCVFVPVSFGNILDEDFGVIYKRMRSVVSRPIRTECPSGLLRETLENHRNGTNTSAIPYAAIEQTWQRLFSEKNP
jgi:MoaA/NifB/PqqE/SkfB family radical SAM enzyme